MAPSLSTSMRRSFARNFSKKSFSNKHQLCMTVRSKRLAHCCQVLRRSHLTSATARIITIDAQKLRTSHELRHQGLKNVVAVNCDGNARFKKRCKDCGVICFGGTLSEYLTSHLMSELPPPLAVYADTMFVKGEYVLNTLAEAMATKASCIQLTIIRRSMHASIEKVYQSVLHSALLNDYEPLGGWKHLSEAVLHNDMAYVVMLLRRGFPESLHQKMLAMPSAEQFQLSHVAMPRGKSKLTPCLPELCRQLKELHGSSVDFTSSRWRLIRKSISRLTPKNIHRVLQQLRSISGALENYRRWQQAWMTKRASTRAPITDLEFAAADALHWEQLSSRLPARTLVEFPGHRIAIIADTLRSCSNLLMTGVSAKDLSPGRKAAMTKGHLSPEIVEKLESTFDSRFKRKVDALLVIADEGDNVSTYLQERLDAVLSHVAASGMIGWAVKMHTGRSPVMLWTTMTQWMNHRGYRLALRASAAWPLDDRSAWFSELYERL